MEIVDSLFFYCVVSVLQIFNVASGDVTKSDTYRLRYSGLSRTIWALNNIRADQLPRLS